MWLKGLTWQGVTQLGHPNLRAGGRVVQKAVASGLAPLVSRGRC